MFNPLSVCIGLRYTRAKRRNHFISFISAVSMAGLTLGVAVLILVLSVLNGFDRELRTRILGTVPHALLEFEDARTDLDPIAEKLLSNRSIIGVAPLNQGEGLLVANGRTVSVAVLGVDPVKESQVSILPGHMTQGEFTDLNARRFSIILGSGIAANLGVIPGDQVTLLIPEATLSLAGVTPRLKRLQVAGIFEVGAQLDNQLAFVELSDAARLFKLGEGIAALRLQFENLFDAPQLIRPIAQDVSTSLGLPIRYQDWTRTQGNLFEAIQLEKTMIALLLTLIIAVAAFNIVSTLVMVVTDKRADIAILKTIGLSPAGIMGVFVVQGTLVGVVGTVFGVILGVPLALSITEILAFLESVFGFYLFNPSAYFISDLPSELRWSDVGLVTTLSTGLSLIATLYPALKASRIIPAEVLNHER
jgi:lipoprotein-releasing system permease protein